jgi:Ca2+-binding RTX toxin-like protein
LIEPRRLLSASIVNNTLVVTEGDGDDTVDVELLGSFTQVTENGQQSGFDSTTFDGISVDGGGGNDNLTVFENTGPSRAATTVHGGDGNDTLDIDREFTNEESGGDAFYFGDAGDDTFTFLRVLTNRFFSGGPGIDSVSYGIFSTVGGISVTLDDQTNDGPHGADNVHSDVEQITGTIWDDTLVGTDGGQTLDGGAGDDSLDGGGGADSLAGDDGNDTLVGSAADGDTLDGGSGTNTPVDPHQPPPTTPPPTTPPPTQPPPTEPPPTEPPPTQPPQEAQPTWHLTKGGSLRVDGTDNADKMIIQPLAGDPSMLSITFNNQSAGTVSIDKVLSVRIDGKAGSDRLVLTLPGDRTSMPIRIYGGAGNDTIHGSGGNDRIYGGDGNDWIAGNEGSDVIYGEAGADRIFGGDDRDFLFGGPGTDHLRGEGGRDAVRENQ